MQISLLTLLNAVARDGTDARVVEDTDEARRRLDSIELQPAFSIRDQPEASERTSQAYS